MPVAPCFTCLSVHVCRYVSLSLCLLAAFSQQIVASDGVWDVMDPREAANRVMDVVSAGGTAEEAARQLVQDTIMLAGCSPGSDTDNTTALVAVFE